MKIKELDKSLARMKRVRDYRIGLWEGFTVRFVRKDMVWYVVGLDIANALEFENSRKALIDHCPNKVSVIVKLSQIATSSDVTKNYVRGLNFVNSNDLLEIQARVDAVRKQKGKSHARKTQTMVIIPEKDVYRLILRSNKPKAVDFQDWVCDRLVAYREDLGLDGFEMLRLLDSKETSYEHYRLNQVFGSKCEKIHLLCEHYTNCVVGFRINGVFEAVKKEDTPQELMQFRKSVLTTAVTFMIERSRLENPPPFVETLKFLFCRT